MDNQEDLIPLPEINDLKEMLTEAKKDLKDAVSEAPELAEHGKIIEQVMTIVEEKISAHKDFDKLSLKEKIDLAAHISFLEFTLDEFFFNGAVGEFDEEDFDDEECEEEEECEDDKNDRGHSHGGGCCGGHKHN